MKILILCTGNSCRSQMAEGFLTSFDPRLTVSSAGTHPSSRVHPKAIQAMLEAGIDLMEKQPKHVEEFIKDRFDYVITVCGGAKENCPVFLGEVKHRLHIGFEDPAEATGTEDEILAVFRRVRDEIKEGFYDFYENRIKKELNPAYGSRNF